jgi:hypothetical protein
MTVAAFAGLASKGIDRVDATDGLLSLSVAQFQALGAVALTAADAVTLADSGARLAALDVGTLAGKGIDRLDATNDVLSLTVAQYQALGPVSLSSADTVTLADTGAKLASLSMGPLAGKGIDRLDATDDVLVLTLAQVQALGAVGLTAGDAVTVTGSGAALGALSAAEIGALAGKGIDRIDAADNALSLDLAQFNGLGTTLLATDDVLSLAGTPDGDLLAFTYQRLGAPDRVDGGAGTDTLSLGGDYSGGLQLEADTVRNVEKIQFAAGNSYVLATADGTVAAGQTLTVNGGKLGATNTLVFDGSAETDGRFSFTGGGGSNTFTGGKGADQIAAGTGSDVVRYTAASQSTSAAYDTVSGFDAAVDRFFVWSGVTGVDAPVVMGKLSTATFDTDLAAAMDGAHLLAHHAALFTASTGTLAGAQFVVVDANGSAGYQAGDDLAVRVTAPTNIGAFGMGNFV